MGTNGEGRSYNEREERENREGRGARQKQNNDHRLEKRLVSYLSVIWSIGQVR